MSTAETPMFFCFEVRADLGKAFIADGGACCYSDGGEDGKEGGDS